MKRRISHWFIPVLCTGLLLSCSHAPQVVSAHGDGFPRSIPETKGVATEGILSFLEAVETEELEVHSFMLLRYGTVIAEAWWYPYKPDISHVMHSVSKTFTSTAIGFAVSEKLLTVDDKVISFFPGDLPAEVSPYLQELAIKDLLTMSAGSEQAIEFTAEDGNWVKAFLAMTVADKPGSRFLYNSYATYMLSAIIQKVAGETTFDYLTPRLFEPLGIKDVKWETDTQGITVGGWGMRIKTSDMAKLGQFYLQKGMWRGKQLLPESWITEASSPHIYQRPERTAEENAGDFGAQGYGYQIWMCPDNSYRADGANAQFIVVAPAKNAVIVTTSNTSQAHKLLGLMWKHLIPAMVDNVPGGGDDASSKEALNSRTSSLQIKHPFLTPEEVTYPKETTLSYRMEPNDLGVREATFRFDGQGNCTLSLLNETGTYDFSFGQDSWSYGETQKPGPYYLNLRRNPAGMPPFRVAGFAAWTQAEQLSLRLLYLNDSRYETWVCDFKDSQVTVTHSNNEQSGNPPLVLRGRSGNI
jgi:CubicO group peptidase (beta-lactamase class C family)